MGAVTFSDSVRVSKAVIVAGGGPSTPDDRNQLWEDTQMSADYAYRALLYQGYKRENIKYLSAGDIHRDLDGDDLLNDVDGEATMGQPVRDFRYLGQ